MPTRLTSSERTTLALDTSRAPAVVGTVSILDPGEEGFDHQQLMALVADRIRYVPRYRQRVREIPFRLADPVWVDDENFDLAFHVRRAVLPRPGTEQQLHDFVAGIWSQRMDRSHPLWKAYLVEGLGDGRVAVVTATHQCVVNGTDTVDLGQVLLDSMPERAAEPERWHPMPEPSDTDLMAGAVTEVVRDPGRAVVNTAHTIGDVFGFAAGAGEMACAGAVIDDLAADVLRGNRGVQTGVLSHGPGPARRFATVTSGLDDVRAIRAATAHTVHDVILAVITGGLRSWLTSRVGSMSALDSLTAMVPMSVVEDTDEPTALGGDVAGHLLTLPIGAPDPLERLYRVGHGNRAHRQSGNAISASDLTGIAGFAPATLHALGIRAADDQLRRPYDLVITNAPGPQLPLYAGTTQMLASYPSIPISAGHLLAIGVTSYNGRLFIGLNADRDAIPELHQLASATTDAVQELLDALR